MGLLIVRIVINYFIQVLNKNMSDTNLGQCSSCGREIDYLVALGGAQKCDECEEIINDKIKYEYSNEQV